MTELVEKEPVSLATAAPFLTRYSDARGCFAEVPLTTEVSQLMLWPGWGRLREAIVDRLLQPWAPPLRRLLPGLLQTPDDLVENVPLKVRTRNVLRRAGITRWSELAELRPTDLLLWRNAGRTTAKDILGHCVDLGCAALTPALYPSGEISNYVEQAAVAGPAKEGKLASKDELAVQTRSSAMEQAESLLQLVSTWAIQEREMALLGEILPLNAAISGPPDITEALSELAKLELPSLASRRQSAPKLEGLSSQLLSELHHSERFVYRRRLLDASCPTLEEVGREMGITRERVRQLQKMAETKIEEALAKHEYRTLRWRAWDLRASLGAEAPLSHPEYLKAIEKALRGSGTEIEPIVRLLLLHIAGPYREKDGWLLNQNSRRVNPKELATIADDRGIIALADAERWLLSREIRAPFHEEWILRTKQFRRSNDRLLVWSGGAVDKCVTLLACARRPMDAESLVRAIGEGHNSRGIRARLFEDRRLMRVNRTMWALREWDMEEYTGIAEEIAQRIHDWGGKARLSDLIDELVPLFGVRETSVRVYAQAPMFVNEGGWVRLRTLDEEPFVLRTELSACKGIFRTSSGLHSLHLVDSEVARGSGRLFPDAAAALLGVSPGNRRAFEHESGPIVISWPATAGLGPTIGSIRKLADSVGAVEGDFVRIAFSSELGTVTVARIVPEELAKAGAVEALSLVCGIERDLSVEEALGFAIGVAPTAVRRTLKHRGDDLVRDLLPDDQLDEDLEAALEDFAKLLDSGG